MRLRKSIYPPFQHFLAKILKLEVLVLEVVAWVLWKDKSVQYHLLEIFKVLNRVWEVWDLWNNSQINLKEWNWVCEAARQKYKSNRVESLVECFQNQKHRKLSHLIVINIEVVHHLKLLHNNQKVFLEDYSDLVLRWLNLRNLLILLIRTKEMDLKKWKRNLLTIKCFCTRN